MMLLMFQETTVLKHLDLSKNLFGEAGGQLLGSAIGKVVDETKCFFVRHSWVLLRRGVDFR